MTLADFTSPNLILPQLSGRNAMSMIAELCLAMHRAGRVADWHSFYQAVMAREAQATTEMEVGMAIPHARIQGIPDLLLAFGISAEPLAWWSNSAPTVRLVFLLAVPDNHLASHLLVLSGLARMTNDVQLLHDLHAARTVERIMEVFSRIPLGRPALSASLK